MSKRAVVIQHLAFEDLGVLKAILEHRGFEIHTYEVGAAGVPDGDFVDAELAVVLGGPIGVYEEDVYPFLAQERAVIASRLQSGRPLLGICLGAQLIASALGAQVRSTGRKEIGYAPLELTAAGRDSVLVPLDGVPVLHWHGDEFAIPEGAERLAQTPGFPNQAFRLGDAVLGLQFHIEADPTFIERWLIGHAHELATAGLDVARIREDARVLGPRLARQAGRVFEAWLDLVGPQEHS